MARGGGWCKLPGQGSGFHSDPKGNTPPCMLLASPGSPHSRLTTPTLAPPHPQQPPNSAPASLYEADLTYNLHFHSHPLHLPASYISDPGTDSSLCRAQLPPHSLLFVTTPAASHLGGDRLCSRWGGEQSSTHRLCRPETPHATCQPDATCWNSDQHMPAAQHGAQPQGSAHPWLSTHSLPRGPTVTRGQNTGPAGTMDNPLLH